MRAFFAFWVFLAGMLLTGPVGMAQETGPAVDKEIERRVARLNQQVNELDREVARLSSKTKSFAANAVPSGLFLFLFGAFCAMGAEYKSELRALVLPGGYLSLRCRDRALD